MTARSFFFSHVPIKRETLALIWISIFTFLIVGYFSLLQFQTRGLLELDGYFHIRLSSLMRQDGIFISKPWLRFTIFSDHYLDHHYLFHILQMPFTFGNLIIGGKLSVVFFSSFMTLIFYFLLKDQKIPHPYIWTVILLVCSDPFLYRMSMARVQNVSLTCLLLGCLLLLKQRWRTFAILAAGYTWLYLSASVFLPILLGFYVVSERIVEGTPFSRFRKPILWCAGLYTAALLINPHFPSNLYFIYKDIADKVSPDFKVSVGNEWYPYDSWFLFTSSLPVFACLGLSLVGSLLRERRPSARTLFFLFISILYLVMFLKSRRFVEYWPPFTILFAASSYADWIGEGKPLLSGWKALHRNGLKAALALALILGGTYNVAEVMDGIAGNKPAEEFRDASLWLKERLKPEEVVMNLDWDDFPRLFFYNPDNYYVVGLDPAYMYMYDPELYKQWRAITRGEIEDPSSIISSRFHSRFVVSDDDHEAFQRQAEKDPNIQLVYQDRWSKIYRISEK